MGALAHLQLNDNPPRYAYFCLMVTYKLKNMLYGVCAIALGFMDPTTVIYLLLFLTCK